MAKKNIINQQPELLETKPINLFTKKFSVFSINSWKGLYIKKFKTNKVIYCNFELNNGNHTTCILPIENGRVIFNNGTYLVDDALKYYHLGFQECMLDYHEGFSLPIKRKFPLNDINIAIQSSNIHNISYATNPNVLRTFQINDVVRSAIQAAGITDFFKQVRLLVIISALASVISLLILAQSEGYFKGITG